MALPALVACTAKDAAPPAADSAAARAAAPAPAAAATTSAPRPHVSPEVEAICAAVAGWWRRDPSATVLFADSLATPPSGDTVVAGCLVVARQEHGMKRDADAPRDTVAARLGAAVTLVRSSGKGWIELIRYMADGPDGGSSAFQRGAVRCAVERRRDGGDDSDPSYVPEEWYEEHTLCWAAPEGIAVSDTGR